MTNEQKDNLGKLEQITDKLERVLNLFNLAGYEASIEEIAEIDKIARIATACQKWARVSHK